MNKPERLAPRAPLPSFFDALAQRGDTLHAAHAAEAGDGPQSLAPGDTLQRMIALGLDQLCLPGQGLTLSRWQALAAVAAQDLSLVKLFEAHTDALAILAEAGPQAWQAAAPIAPPAAWAVWCAEPPDARVVLSVPDKTVAADSGEVRLCGTKAWCSGAAAVTHALVSCWEEGSGKDGNNGGRQCLVAVALAQPGVHVTSEGWQAVGMAGTGSVDVVFDHARAYRVGAPGFYTGRAGFWHGGAGIAACWYGAAARLADHLRERLASRGNAAGDAIALAQLGKADVALSTAAGLLRETARWIDVYPERDAQRVVLRARLAVEQAALAVMAAAGQTLGAALYCREGFFARLLADLPVFLRQSHAGRDYAALGRCILDEHSADDAAGNELHNALHNGPHNGPLWAL